jgi:WD40 repeat protein
VGPSADIYALGAILYEVLTGRRPFLAEAVLDVLEQVRWQEPVPPGQLRAKLPRDLQTICLKCLEKAPAKRYPTAQALADDLRCYLADQPVQARPVSQVERQWRWCRRNPWVAGLATLAVFLLLAGTTVSTYFGVWMAHWAVQADKDRQDAEYQAGVAQTQKQRADLEAESAGSNARRAWHRAYISDLIRVPPAWEENQISQVLELLTQQLPEHTGNEDQRNFEWHYWWHLCHADLFTLKGHTEGVISLAYSADGLRLASADQNGKVNVWDATTGTVVLSRQGQAPGWNLALSPDARRLASVSEKGNVQVLDLATGTAILSFQERTGNNAHYGLAFGPGGEQLASIVSWVEGQKTPKSELKVWDLPTGKVVHTLTPPNDWRWHMAFSPDGTRLVAATTNDRQGRVTIWNAQTGKEERSFGKPDYRVGGLAFSPDGTRLAVAFQPSSLVRSGYRSRGPQGPRPVPPPPQPRPPGAPPPAYGDPFPVLQLPIIQVHDAATGQELVSFQPQSCLMSIRSLAFSPDGKRLACGLADWSSNSSFGGEVKVWDLPTKQEVLTFKGHTSGTSAVAFSPDGRRLASASWDQTVKVWDVTTAPEGPILTSWDSAFSTFSPDLRLCAALGPSDTIQIWDIATGQIKRTIKAPGKIETEVVFSPDGQRVACSTAGTLRVWDIATGKEQRHIPLSSPNLLNRRLAFSPDGTCLAATPASQRIRLHPAAPELRTVRVWDVTTGEEKLGFVANTLSIDAVTFSPDGRRLVGIGYRPDHDRSEVKIWEAASGREIATLHGHEKYDWIFADHGGVAFSPDGRSLAFAPNQPTVPVWDVATGQQKLTLKGHTSTVNRVVFSPNGRLATVARDDTVRLWDVASGQELLSFSKPTVAQCSVAFSQDGQRLGVTGSRQAWVWVAPRDR